MFFVHVMGRKSSRSFSAKTLTGLGTKVEREMADGANDSIVVSIGKDENAVMPYVWIRRNQDTDEWEGELGDGIRLGIEDGLLVETDPIQMLGLDQAILRGIVSVQDDGDARVVSVPPPIASRSKKQSEKELQDQANKMVRDLFTRFKEE
jgi:hypothetical protein